MQIEKNAKLKVKNDYNIAFKSSEPDSNDLYNYDFAPTKINKEKGTRNPKEKSNRYG